ncbi:hypothetical protein NBRC110019_23380 [Neptunitalea chrysea]|uniref:Prenyltransferase n=1 Tax=Neptunitalea chrysea TaxID=1647581 RepID=A0A9W6B7K8_9FLAO|nr:hypothetical protein [Neptunitalea chrysea]GLB53297.1 hypothetical protein NBRC110019_23380 [Neptunitalea chrysea]
MKFLKNILKFYIEGSIHVALSVVCLTALTFEKFHMGYDLDLCAVSFLATISSYNFMKYATNAETYFSVATVYLKIIQGLSIFCFVAMLVLACFLSIEVLGVLALSSFFTAIYALPLLPGNKSFRNLSGLKIYMVGFCWALITVIIPVVDDHVKLDNRVWVEFVQRFLLVIILIIPFDIRDLKEDGLVLGTLPQRLGVAKSKGVGYILLSLFFLLTFVNPVIEAKEVGVTLSVTALTALFIVFAKEQQSKYYCGFWVESVPIIWYVIYLLLPSF